MSSFIEGVIGATRLIARGHLPNAAFMSEGPGCGTIFATKETLSEVGTPCVVYDMANFGPDCAEILRMVLAEHLINHINDNSILILDLTGWYDNGDLDHSHSAVFEVIRQALETQSGIILKLHSHICLPVRVLNRVFTVAA